MMKFTLFALLTGLLMLVGCAEEREIEQTKSLAKQGDANAQYILGLMYDNGKGVPQDYKEAVKWLRMSADQGYALAQCFLGLMYDEGKGVPQDYKEAVKWYRISAEQGEAMAQSILAVMYMNGKGVPQDYKKAYAWTSVGKAFDEELAEEHLGVIKKKMTKEQIAEAESLSTEIQNRIEANRKE